MRALQPFVELFHEALGTVSAHHRRVAEALRATPSPRPEALAAQVSALHAPWWGFFAYGVLYAMTAMALAALFAAAGLEVAAKKLHWGDGLDWTAYFWAGAALTAPLSALPFRAWMRRRRRELREVAAQGTLAPGEVVKATVVTVHGGFSWKGAAHSTHLTVAVLGVGTFRGYVAKAPSWAAPGAPVELLVLASAQHALLLCSDGGTRPLLRA